MSDDFDKDDDLSWLQNDDEQPEDDEKFDWQQGDKAGKPQKREQSLGFTGELPWLQDDESAPGSEKSGLTGELPWMQGDDDPAAAEEDDLSWLSGGDELVEYGEVDDISDEEALDWISADDADFEAAAKPAPEPDPDVPDWLKGTDTSQLVSQEPASPEPDIDDAPDWLKSTPPEPVPDPIMDVPDWLMGADEEPPEEETNFAPGGKLSAEWLAQGEALPETSDSDLTFDEWVVKQAAAERVPDLDEQMPDLDELSGEVTPADLGTGELPDWFLGMEELDTSNAPSWFTDEEPAPTPPPTGELDDLLPDWLMGDTDQPAEAASMSEMAGDEFPDWLSEEANEDIQETAASLDTDFLSNLGLGDKPQTPAPMPNFNTGQLNAMFGDDTDEDIQETAASPGDDFFSTLEMGDQPQTPETTFNTGELNAMFGDDIEDEIPETAPTFDDDFFNNLGLDDQTPLPDMGELSAMLGDDIDIGLLDALENQGRSPEERSVDDYIASLSSDETVADSTDWFGDEAEPEQAAEMDWLDQLGDMDEQPDEAALVGNEFGAALASVIEPPEPSAIDNILASLEAGGAELPDTDELMNQEVDFDSLLSDPAFSGIEAPRAQSSPTSDILPGDGLDFLTELGASVSANSAAAIVRQRKDRPLDELPDRLKKLRDRGDEAIKPPPKGNTGPLAELLPGVSGTLVPSIIEVDSPGIAGTVTITPEQRGKIDLLKSLTITDEAAPQSTRLSAIDRTYDTPFLSDEDDFPDLELTPTEKPDENAVPAAPRQRTRVKIDRIFISLLVAVGAILPFFVGATRIGSLPPSQFTAGSRQQGVFDSLSTLNAGQFVLVGVEYGPTAAAELDTTTTVLLRHILAQGARPVIVSGNPVALLRANNIIDGLNQIDSPLLAVMGRSTPLIANEDYFVTRYLAGNLVGLRALGGNMSAMLATDFRGQASNLNIRSLNDFAAVVVIAERAEDLRAWVEQISPLTNAPVLAAVGFAAEPLAEPYLGTGIDGLLVGYRDAFTYDKMLASGFIPATQIVPSPTTAPEIEATAEVTTEATQEVIEATPEITATPTIATQIGTIRSDTNVNLRSGPGTSFATIGTISSGDLVEVLGSSDDGEWTNIRLTNGTEGWVSSSLVRVSGAPETQVTSAPTETAPTEIAPTETAVATSTPRPTNTTAPPTATRILPTNTPTATNTPAPSNTPAPTHTPSITPTTIPTVITARVIADTRINVRSGPGTTFQPVSAVNPGTEFIVIGRNGDGSWIQVQMEDGREGWVSASLVEVSVAEADVPPVTEASSELIIVMADGDFGISGLMPRALQQEETPEATPEETPEAAPVESTDEPTPIVAVETAQSIPYGEQRWYSMTLGLAVIIVVIVLGALVNIVRGLLKRK